MRGKSSRAPGAVANAVLAATLGGMACFSCIARTPTPQSKAAQSSEPPVAASLTITPSEHHQMLEGFGASVAWYQNKLVPNPPKGIFDLLFPELGLDILRLRNRYHRMVKRDDDNIAEDVEILKRATAALGRRPKVLLSSWSPPADLKANRAEDCHGNDDCTLVRENGQFVYDKFAAYWHDSLAHYASLGIVPDWVSIENEPSFIPPSWEGCKFDPTESARYPGYDRAFAAVHESLSTLPNRPKMLGPEVLGIHHGLLENYVKPMRLDLVDGIAHHIYELGDDKVWDWKDPGPDSFIDEMQAAAALGRETGKPLFQTESEPKGAVPTKGASKPRS
jgi:glucuronoarabinoxylan endo-1,4-beta-xylanase